MNEEQYRAVCKACDQLLQAPGADCERIATPWLHVIRAHPIFLDRYTEIFSLPSFKSSWARYVRNIASALRHLAKAIVSGSRLWRPVGELPKKCDVLIISHLISEEFTRAEGDFYFGQVASEIVSDDLSTTIGLINYTGIPPKVLSRGWQKNNVARVILNSVLTPLGELSLYRRMWLESRRLKAVATEQVNNINQRVAERASREVLSGGTAAALRLGVQIKALVELLQPRAIVVTYEGHSWERIAFAAARSVSPQIKCIGYQHAALFNQQHAIQTRLARHFNPDVILTSGKVAQARLRKNPQLEEVRIVTFGSNRAVDGRAEVISRTSQSRVKACLVLPEGLLNECILLFGFALKCAQQLPDIKFIWRLHPSMNYETLKRSVRDFRVLPSNVCLSIHSLEDDIARSTWALYRGSTAIVQAAASGVRPVYLHQVGEMPIDTLFEISELHPRVVEPDDFVALLSADDADVHSVQIQEYCEQMFTPLDSRQLAACVAERN